MKKTSQASQKRAFSLLELSIVTLIIGVLIAGVLVSRNLISRFYLKTAETVTVSSPVNSIPNNALWLETSLESSIDNAQESDGDNVTYWKDQNASYIKKTSVVAVGTGPEYANTINKVHAIKFVGSNSNHLRIQDASFLNDTDYTIFVLEKRQSDADNNYFIGTTSSNANDALALGYSQNASVIHAQGSNAYTAGVSSYANSVNKARIFTFYHSGTFGNKTFINGVLAAQNNTTDHLSGVTSLDIGKGYVGEIGEIVIYSRALKNEERTSIEDYLGKKWRRSVNRDAVSNGSCINGVVTDSGCSMDCSTSSISGVTSPSSITDGDSGVTLTCGATGYDGSITASCNNGSITKSADCACDSSAGYVASGSSCIQKCSVSVTGVTNTTPVANGSGTLTCDDTHYDGGEINYTCSGTTLSTASSCNCATGRSGVGCNSCDTSAYYYSIGGSCVQGCIIPSGSGTTTTLVGLGSSSVSCNAGAEFSGNLLYTCSAGGSLTITQACDVDVTCSATGSYNQSTITVGSETIPIYSFSGNGTFSCPTTKTVQVLVVGGGGGGSADVGGGGGGGQVVATTLSVNGTANITVGGGGARGYNRVGNSTGSGHTGQTSSIVMGSTTISALGGSGARGRAGGWNNYLAGTGYTGGGAGYPDEVSAGSVGTGGASYKGGDSSGSGGGGGGGAGGAGYSRSSGAHGGIGAASSITGISTYYGGGGGGSGYGVAGGNGGNGGGGAGTNNTTDGANGIDGLGGGGGGAGSNGSATGGGGRGGSGIVIIREN